MELSGLCSANVMHVSTIGNESLIFARVATLNVNLIVSLTTIGLAPRYQVSIHYEALLLLVEEHEWHLEHRGQRR